MLHTQIKSRRIGRNILQLELLESRIVPDASHPVVLESVKETESTAQLSWVPNDELFSSQWNFRNTGQSGGIGGADIGAPGAWGKIAVARKVGVAVIDTGIDYRHPDLYLNIWVNQGEIPASRRNNFVDVDRDGLITLRDLNNPINQGLGKITDLNGNCYIDAGDLLQPMIVDASGKDTGRGGWANGIDHDRNGYVDDIVGWNFINNTNNPFDDNGHGSHVAGTIGASGNDKTGVTGVAWNVQLVGLKMFDNQGRGYMESFAQAVDYCIAKGIKIINCSWIDTVYLKSAADAIGRAEKANVLIVAAAGNQKRSNDVTPVYPAGYKFSNVITVAATDNRDQLAAYSNFGVKTVDIAAPGTNILSTNSWSRYGYRSGTSMAAPHVAGAAALISALRGEWTPLQIITWLKQTAKRLPSLTGKVASGRLDLAAAVNVPPRTNSQLTAAQLANHLQITTASVAAIAGTPTSSVRLTSVEPTTARDQLFTQADALSFVVTGISQLEQQSRSVPVLWREVHQQDLTNSREDRYSI